MGFMFLMLKSAPTLLPNSQQELLTSKNRTWKQEVVSHAHYHLTPTEESAWASLFPRKKLIEGDEFNWNSMYKKIKFFDLNKLEESNFLMEVSLHNVRLDTKSLHGQAQETNLEYLLMLDVDRLAWSFRKTAGLSTPGTPYAGWEASDVELRGHYLSATAKMWASTHNKAVKKIMNALVSALKECQNKMGTGYLSAFPSEFFDRFEAIKSVWAPYYTIHKIMAGLLDQYKFACSSQALKMVTWMADYFHWRVQNVIKKFTIERHWFWLNEETCGMNDVLYQLFSVTGDKKHLVLAHLFDKPCFLGLFALKADDISGFHANTHIPIVIGAQTRYEITGDELYKEMGTFLLDIVNSTHTFAIGGTSVSEFWNDPKRLDNELGTENEESCTTYNMLKVSRNLFRWTRKETYAGYCEHALTNGVLSIQRGKEPGIMIYMLPLGHGVSKGRSYHGWGTAFDSFWCCYGTGIESFSKLGDSIYFEEMGRVPGLYVIQYISSSINWKSNILKMLLLGITASNTVHSGFSYGYVEFADPILDIKRSTGCAKWETLQVAKFRSWYNADEILLEFPLSLRTEVIQDDRPEFASLQGILYGSYFLAGLSKGDYDIQTGPVKSISDWITPARPYSNSLLISLSQKTRQAEFFLSNQKQLIKMQASPQDGFDSYVHATFRLILKDTVSEKHQAPEGLIGKWVMFEPFDLPGTTTNNTRSAEFFIVKGLNGQKGTVSLQTKAGCFVYSEKNNDSSLGVKLGSEPGSKDATFREAASFIWNEGLKKYHPISFVAKGLRRSYVLEPLFALRDESYINV
ncbi:hypothetical protein Cgig2_000123 [Carnegiea gigantea]|uniref:Non-reducing end beta-L-arabinofuranosidase-like GH127 catalytic domain-containing protein n=1 Tax=Carnegiea gigantea TaxID=171969 RepID=A0A9Q1QSJ1_9CARY|nr:hypothetical protein Cgig2_000123 [Carnegiea gigantea]